MTGEPGKRQPDAVLFCCNFNQVRSPMAESLLKHIAGTRIFVDSCGLRRGEYDAHLEELDGEPLGPPPNPQPARGSSSTAAG